MDRKALLAGLGYEALATAILPGTDVGAEGEGSLSKAYNEGACGGEGSCGSGKKKRKKKGAKAKAGGTEDLNPDAKQGGLTKAEPSPGDLDPIQLAATEAHEQPSTSTFRLEKSWDLHAMTEDDGVSWAGGRPRLSAPPSLELETRASEPAPPPREYPPEQLEGLAKSFIDAAIRDAYRFELTVAAAQNPAQELLTKGALGHERPSLPPDMVAAGALNAPEPELAAVAKRAAGIVRQAARATPELRAGLAHLGTTERSIGERLVELRLDPAEVAAGR